MRHPAILVLPALLALPASLAGCGGDEPGADSGTDAGPIDAARDPVDAADDRDASIVDGGFHDAADADAGPLDGGIPDGASLPDPELADGGMIGGWSGTVLVPWSRLIGSEPDATITDIDLVMDWSANVHACAALRMRTGTTTYERRLVYVTDAAGAFDAETILAAPFGAEPECSIAVLEAVPYVASIADTANSLVLRRRTASSAWEDVAVPVETPPGDVSEVALTTMRADSSGLTLVLRWRHRGATPLDPPTYEHRAVRFEDGAWGSWRGAGASLLRIGSESEIGVLRAASRQPGSSGIAAGMATVDPTTGTLGFRALADATALSDRTVTGVSALALAATPGLPQLVSAIHYDCSGFSCQALVLSRLGLDDAITHDVLSDMRVGQVSTARCADEAVVMHREGTTRTLWSATPGNAPISTALTVATSTATTREAIAVDCADRIVLLVATNGELVVYDGTR